MAPIWFRPIVFSGIALVLALLTSPNRLIPDRQHPICAQHPVLSAACSAIHNAIKRPTYPSEILPLTRALMAIQSTSGSELRAMEYAAEWLRKQNWQVREQWVAPLTGFTTARQNVLALQPGTSASEVQVVLCTHLDTVPGAGLPPDAKEVENGMLRGRGSCDAKGQAAGMMLAATAMRDARVAVLLLSGEETDHGGMRVAHKLRLPSDVVLLNGEPTESKLAMMQKGAMRLHLSVKGRAAHSGYPELGVSAVHALVDVLADLRKVDWPQGDGNMMTTMNIGAIRGGTAANVVADEAGADLLFRLIEEPDAVLEKVREVAAHYDNVTVQAISSNAPVTFKVPQQAGADLGTINVAYNTDIPYYQGKFSDAVLFGVGSIKTAHSQNEFISLDELELLPQQLQQITAETLAMTGKCRTGAGTETKCG